MRIRAVVVRSMFAVLALVVVMTAGCGGALFRQYEYEEEIYVSLDGTATAYVNSSVAALNALRGTSFDQDPRARLDRAAVGDYFTSPATHVTRVTTSRRNNRQYVHVRLDVDDIRQMPKAAPFSWSTYAFGKNETNLFVYRQQVGAAAAKPVGAPGWNGRELVAFRLHLPSRIVYHNTKRGIGRGNILVWEQSLTDRLASRPLEIETRLESQSILYRTLWLFGWTFVAVAIVFVLVVWWIVRKGVRAKQRS